MSLKILRQRGWLVLENVYSTEHLSEIRKLLRRLAQDQDDAIREQSGAVYAARNVLQIVPDIASAWKTSTLTDLVFETLGPQAGLVRALYFDKPPEQTWALPWHKDRLIAIGEATQQQPGYSKPRPRAGVLHTEPPVEVLESMLTLRIHIDRMTNENGPLEVLSGSHQTGKELIVDGFPREQITSPAGAVFVMRPLLVHASGRSVPNSAEHRRVLHLEFSGMPTLPQGVQWHTFLPLSDPA